MAIPEQFSLRWNDFHSNLSQGFHALLEDEDLVDVTLAAGGQYVHAHKLILSICSPYFKELFKTNPCDHPIVILKDVELSELRQLLQFMYKGEVNVRQQELSGFLHTAELLQVKGLTTGRERSESPPPVSSENQVSSVKSEPGNDFPSADWVPGGEETIATETTPVAANNVEDENTRSPLKRLLKNPSNKTNSVPKKRTRLPTENSTPNDITEYTSDGEPLLDFDNDLYHSTLDIPDPTKYNMKQEGFNLKQEGGWNCKTGGVKCPSCNRFFANRYNLKVHIRDKHDTLEGTLKCEICHKRMRNPSCLRVHMYHHRKQAAYLAAQLNSQGDQTSNTLLNSSEKWKVESNPASNRSSNPDSYDCFRASGDEEVPSATDIKLSETI